MIFFHNRESALEVTKGIREYFNISLSLQLLYKCERTQFEEIVNENPDSLPSQLYGAFHLLRLFGNRSPVDPNLSSLVVAFPLIARSIFDFQSNSEACFPTRPSTREACKCCSPIFKTFCSTCKKIAPTCSTFTRTTSSRRRSAAVRRTMTRLSTSSPLCNTAWPR